MKYHFIHALVLTPYEATLTPLDWYIVGAQDYPIHALYCQELHRIVFLSDNQKNDCTMEISKILDLLILFKMEVFMNNQIIVLEENENGYSEQDVLKHFS